MKLSQWPGKTFIIREYKDDGVAALFTHFEGALQTQHSSMKKHDHRPLSNFSAEKNVISNYSKQTTIPSNYNIC